VRLGEGQNTRGTEQEGQRTATPGEQRTVQLRGVAVDVISCRNGHPRGAGARLAEGAPQSPPRRRPQAASRGPAAGSCLAKKTHNFFILNLA
jgi:hypothetical protein